MMMMMMMTVMLHMVTNYKLQNISAPHSSEFLLHTIDETRCVTFLALTVFGSSTNIKAARTKEYNFNLIILYYNNTPSI
jgi:hypothetical protein